MAWAPDYATASEFKAYARIGDTDDDVQIGYALTAASRAIDRCASRQFGQVSPAEERIYTAAWDRRRCRWFARIDDIGTTSSLVVVLSGTTVTDYTLEPRNAVANGKVWEQIVFGQAVTATTVADNLSMTGLWGWPSVPVAIKQATLLQASRFLARRDSPYGVAGSPADGSELRLLAKVDPDVAVAVSRYTRLWAAV